MSRSSLAILLMVFAVSASAEDFDYSFAQANYSQIDIDGAGDGDLLGLDLSFAISDSFHLVGGFGTGDVDTPLGDIDVTAWHAGLGFNTELSQTIDLVARLSYVYDELELAGVSVDDSGIGLGLGLRFAVSDRVQANAGIDYDDVSEETGISLDFQFSLTDSFAVGLGGSWSDDTTGYGVGGRWYFGQ